MRGIVAALCMVSFVVDAENYPARTVHVIVPYLAERWKVAVVTDNKPVATGNIGADFVAKSAPDGHTLLFVATGLAW